MVNTTFFIMFDENALRGEKWQTANKERERELSFIIDIKGGQNT